MSHNLTKMQNKPAKILTLSGRKFILTSSVTDSPWTTTSSARSKLWKNSSKSRSSSCTSTLSRTDQ